MDKRVREAIKAPIPCDIFQDDPLSPATFEPFDLITSSLCLEAAAPDLATYKTAVQRLSRYLKPGGYFVLDGVLNQNFYEVGNGGEKFYSLSLNKKDIENSLVEAGFEEPTWYIHFFDVNVDKFQYEFDAGGWFALSAKKK